MIKSDFDHIRTWIFDLDNTLYPPSVRLFDQIETRMTDWVQATLGVSQAQADTLRRTYWARYGTTLAGLMREHGVDPHSYLHDVHQIDFSGLSPDPDLAATIATLPGRRIVFTNGSRPYAENVLAARGLGTTFDAVYGIEHADFHPKPDRAAFEHIVAHEGADPNASAMFEDVARNLEAPHQMGMRTVLVGPPEHAMAHIQHQTEDLTGFLSQLLPFASVSAS